MAKPSLREHLQRLHESASAAIAVDMDFAAWHDAYFVPLVYARVDAWVLVARSANAATTRAHAQLRADFYPREEALLARARAAAQQGATPIVRVVKPRALPRRGRHKPSPGEVRLSVDAI